MQIKAALLAGTAAALLFAPGARLIGQNPNQAKIHGHVTNPAGMVFPKGDIKLTTDKTSKPEERKYVYTFPIDAGGNYSGTGINAGDYLIVVFADAKVVDFQNIAIKALDDRTVDFDMSRAEYLKAMTPAERAALEEYKKKNAAVSEENSKIVNINKTLLQARDDEKNGKADVAVKSLKDLTAMKPDEAVLWASLGEAQLMAGDTARKAAVAAKTSPSDPAILQNYSDAVTSYKKAIELNASSKKSSPENLAAYYLNLGQAQAKSGDIKSAVDSYDMAAKSSPTMAGSAYYNEAANFFNADKKDEASAAADKAIAADPKRADAYYIKAQSLIGKATTDKTGNYVLPPGCLEAYQEYLYLDPNGAHAKEVNELLVGLKQPVKNSFRAGKK